MMKETICLSRFGSYSITVELTGFKKIERTGI
jgi:hypothetical protein